MVLKFYKGISIYSVPQVFRDQIPIWPAVALSIHLPQSSAVSLSFEGARVERRGGWMGLLPASIEPASFFAVPCNRQEGWGRRIWSREQ